MSPEIIGVIGLIFMFVLLFAGMPIGLGMAFTGFLGIAYLFDINGALHQLALVPFSSSAHYALSVVPLFILMGHFAFASGITEDFYDTAHALLARLRGGLAMSTIAACAGFAACTGSSFAGAATMTKIALPEMKRYKYDPALATGTIAAGGTLGILIPPSNAMIFYALITDASIGRLFIGGIVPGALLSTLFILIIYLMVKIRPQMAPTISQFKWSAVLKSAKRVWPGLILIVIVLGGLWGGVFSPTEAGGMGAFAAFVITVAKRGFVKKHIIDGLRETTRTTAMIFTILIGAIIFGYFMTASGLPVMLVEFIQELAIPPVAVLVVILAVFVFLGCIMDTAALTFVVLPIVFPITLALNFNPVWFGILYVINSEMALITPPIGMNVFVVGGMAPDIPMYTIFKGVLPFVVAMAVCTALIIIFPQIALFLPSTMIK
jgi:C4-dicarboxylate transporter DctM subunit